MGSGVKEKVIGNIVFKDFTDDGVCSRCGECCGNLLPLEPEEIVKIKKYVKDHHIKPFVRNFPTADTSLDMMCPFRDDIKKICTIYHVRPKICRAYICTGDIDNSKLPTKAGWQPTNMRETFFGGKKDGKL